MSDRELWEDVSRDLYDVLGVSPLASEDAIQQAWHRAARQAHPDLGGDGDRFRDVHVAYLVLSDADLRRKYDLRTATGHDRDLSDASPFPDAAANRGAPAPPTDSRTLWLMALVGGFCLVLAYLVPWTTIVIGILVGAFVVGRYVRFWRSR